MNRFTVRFGLWAAVLLVVVTSPTLAASTDSPQDAFTIEAFLEVPVLTSPSVSPDGAHVAYLRRGRDLEEDAYQYYLWIADVPTGATRQITFDGARISGLAWRPDGTLSFRANRDEATQVWINPLDGSEPRPVTDLPDGLSAYWWAPDGASLAVLVPPADEEDEAAGDDAADGDEGDTDEEDDDRADWTVYDRLEHPEEFDQVWLVDVLPDGPADTEPRQLTRAPLNPQHLAWSPDGKRLAVTYNERFSGLVDEEQRVGLLDAATGDLTLVSDPDRHASLAAFSPDGGQLAFYMDRADDLRAYLNLKDLFVRDMKTGEQAALTGDTQQCLSGYGSTPAEPPFWSEDGRRIYLRVADGRDMNVFHLDVGSGALTQLTDLPGNVSQLDLAGGVLAFRESELHRPGAIWAGKPGQARLIDNTDDVVAAYDLVPPIRLELPGHEGVVVEGFLFLPPGQDPDDGPFPFVMEMHGGPFSRYGNTWTTRYPWQVLSHRGYAVFIANPRGGTAYGEDFLRGVYRNFGTDDYLDLMSACDALIERGIADPDRMGFTGYSYGGLSTNNVVSRTDRFRAAVSIAGIFNYVSAMGQSNPQLFVDSYRQPWAGDLERMWEHSPASRAANLRTPTLVMHGADDLPVDPRQSVEFFSYLQLNGVPSRLVLYPGEGHGINRPSHMLDYETRELSWFDHYLLGDEESEGAEAPVPVETTVR